MEKLKVAISKRWCRVHPFRVRERSDQFYKVSEMLEYTNIHIKFRITFAIKWHGAVIMWVMVPKVF
jgi:hypothetical protein